MGFPCSNAWGDSPTTSIHSTKATWPEQEVILRFVCDCTKDRWITKKQKVVSMYRPVDCQLFVKRYKRLKMLRTVSFFFTKYFKVNPEVVIIFTHHKYYFEFLFWRNYVYKEESSYGHIFSAPWELVSSSAFFKESIWLDSQTTKELQYKGYRLISNESDSWKCALDYWKDKLMK